MTADEEKLVRKPTRRRGRPYEDAHRAPAAGDGDDEIAFHAFASSFPESETMPLAVGDDRVHRAGLAEVARLLTVTESCAAALRESTGTIALRMQEIVTSQMARATTLLHLVRFLNGESAVHGRVAASGVVQDVLRAIEPEAALRGVTVSAPRVADVGVIGDEALLAHVLRGFTLTTLEVVESVRGANVTLAVAYGERRCTLSVEQAHASARGWWTSHEAPEESGSDAERIFHAVILRSASRLATLAGGRFEVITRDTFTRLSLQYPVAPGAD